MRKFADLEKKEAPPEPVELTEEQKYEQMQEEIQDKLKKEVRRRKKKMKTHLKKIKKMRLKLGIANIEDEFEAPTDSGLFHMSTIRKQSDLKKINGIQPNGSRNEIIRTNQKNRGTGGGH